MDQRSHWIYAKRAARASSVRSTAAYFLMGARSRREREMRTCKGSGSGMRCLCSVPHVHTPFQHRSSEVTLKRYTCESFILYAYDFPDPTQFD